MNKTLSVLLGCWAIAGLGGGTAYAYHNADFATPVSRGGGNGMYFTGSPRAKRYDCTACHAMADESIGVELASNPPELIDEQRWSPGVRYALTVTMTGEHLGDLQSTSGYNHNSFVAELTDDSGALTGSWSGDDPEQVFTMDVAGGDPRVVSGYSDRGGTSWTVYLQAPAVGTGRITLYLGAVDGNAAGGGVDTVVDPFGDDVFVGAWRFCETGSSCDTSLIEVTEEDIEDAHTSPATQGCAVSASAGPGWLLVCAVLAMFVAGRRRWRVLPSLALGLFVVGMFGCVSDSLSDDVNEIPEECPNGICEYTSEGNPFGTSPNLDRFYFECETQPVLQARCANFVCHGDSDRPFVVFAPNRLRIDGEDSKMVTPTTPLEFQANYDAAIAFSRDDSPSESLLLAKPLDTNANGYYHFGQTLYREGDTFETAQDVGYQKILSWIGGATAPADCEPTKEVGL